MSTRRNWLSWGIHFGAIILIIGGCVSLHQSTLLAAPRAQDFPSIEKSSSSSLANMPPFQPTHLTVPRLTIAVDVRPGDYKNGQWNLTKQQAFYVAAATPLFYGHAIEAIFLKLHDLRTNDLLYLTNDNGSVFRFRYEQKFVITPQQTDLLDTFYPERIAVLTCVGSTFENRQVALFVFEGIETDV